MRGKVLARAVHHNATTPAFLAPSDQQDRNVLWPSAKRSQRFRSPLRRCEKL